MTNSHPSSDTHVAYEARIKALQYLCKRNGASIDRVATYANAEMLTLFNVKGPRELITLLRQCIALVGDKRDHLTLESAFDFDQMMGGTPSSRIISSFPGKSFSKRTSERYLLGAITSLARIVNIVNDDADTPSRSSETIDPRLITQKQRIDELESVMARLISSQYVSEATKDTLRQYL